MAFRLFGRPNIDFFKSFLIVDLIHFEHFYFLIITNKEYTISILNLLKLLYLLHEVGKVVYN
ncbi:hypothetical protein JCM30566_18710 [Marinitoga arctica]